MKTKRLLFSICVGLPLMADGSQASPGAADGGEECFYARLRDQLAGED